MSYFAQRVWRPATPRRAGRGVIYVDAVMPADAVFLMLPTSHHRKFAAVGSGSIIILSMVRLYEVPPKSKPHRLIFPIVLNPAIEARFFFRQLSAESSVNHKLVVNYSMRDVIRDDIWFRDQSYTIWVKNKYIIMLRLYLKRDKEKDFYMNFQPKEGKPRNCLPHE